MIDHPYSHALCLVPLPGKAPVAGYVIHTGHDDRTTSGDALHAFRLPGDAWGYHQVLQPGQTGLWALNMVNAGRWLVSQRDVADLGHRLEDVAAWQNARYPERGTLRVRRAQPSDPNLRQTLCAVQRVCVEYRCAVRDDVGVACIVCQDDSYWVQHGADPLPEWLENAADMGDAIAMCHRNHVSAGSDIACLYVTTSTAA